MATGHRLFISYSRVDQAFALKLAEDLRARGFAVWIDQDAIPAGTDWDDEIEKGVGQSDCAVVILSPASVSSRRVRDEIGMAEDERKTIVPILYQRCKVPMTLRRLQHVDFTASYEQGLARLVKDLSASPIASADSTRRVEDGDSPQATPLLSASIPPPIKSHSSAHKSRTASLGVMLAGLILVAIVYALVYGLSRMNDEKGRQAPREDVRQLEPRDRASSTAASASGWTPGQPHSTHPHVKAGLKEGQWVPEDGYEWLNSGGAGDFRVKWMPGVRHRQHPYVITSQTEGRWSPAPGYKWANFDDLTDLRVTSLSP